MAYTSIIDKDIFEEKCSGHGKYSIFPVFPDLKKKRLNNSFYQIPYRITGYKYRISVKKEKSHIV